MNDRETKKIRCDEQERGTGTRSGETTPCESRQKMNLVRLIRLEHRYESNSVLSSGEIIGTSGAIFRWR